MCLCVRDAVKWTITIVTQSGSLNLMLLIDAKNLSASHFIEHLLCVGIIYIYLQCIP